MIAGALAFAALSMVADVRGERVLLLGAANDELALRLHDELIADGFDVIERDEQDVEDAVGSARALDAFAVVVVHAPRVDLWCAANGPPDRVEHAVLDASLVDKDAAAVRAAEIVRARLLRPADRDRTSAARTEPASPVTTTTAPIEHAASNPFAVVDAVDLGVHIEGALASAGLPPSLSLGASVDAVAFDHVVLGVDGALPAFATRVTSADGSADITIASLHALAGARASFGDDVDVALVARVGPAFVSGSGRSTKNTAEHDATVVVADAGVALTLRYAVARPLFLVVGAHVDAFAPTPAFVIGNATIPAGPVTGALELGVAFALPDLRGAS